MSDQQENYRCKRCGAMFDNKPQATAHAEEEFKKVFPESERKDLAKSDSDISKKIAEPETKLRKADKIAAGIDRAGAKIREGLDSYNTVGQAVRRNFDFDAVMDNALSMDGSLGSVSLWGNKKKKE